MSRVLTARTKAVIGAAIVALLGSIAMLSEPADAQTIEGSVDWATRVDRSYSIGRDPTFSPVVVDVAGNSYVLSRSADGLEPYGHELISLDPAGVVRWTRPVAVASVDITLPPALALGPSGEIWLAMGNVDEIDHDTDPATPDLPGRSVIAAFDASGAQLAGWAVDDVVHDLAVNRSSEVILTGMAATGTDAFVAVHQTDGTLNWEKSLIGDALATGRSVEVDEFSQIHLAGNFAGSIDTDGNPATTLDRLTSGGQTDSFVASYDSTGSYRWGLAISGSDDIRAAAMTRDQAGRLLIAGQFLGTADFDGNAATATDQRSSTGAADGDAFVAWYGPGGDHIQTVVIVGGDFAQATGVATDAQGNAFVTGVVAGTGDFDENPATTTDQRGDFSNAFVASYSPAGAYRWATATSNGLDLTRAGGVAVDEGGGVIVAGDHDGTTDFDGDPATTGDSLVGPGGFVVRYIETLAETASLTVNITVDGTADSNPFTLTTPDGSQPAVADAPLVVDLSPGDPTVLLEQPGWIVTAIECTGATANVDPATGTAQLSGVTAGSTASCTFTAVRLGDADCNGIVGLLDARRAAQVAVGAAGIVDTCAELISTSAHAPAAEVNGFFGVTLLDAREIALCAISNEPLCFADG